MKRSSLAVAVLVPASVLVTTAASALMVGGPAPAVPQPQSVVDTVEDTLAGLGLPVDLPALPVDLPALPIDLPALPAVAAPAVPVVPDVVATVTSAAAPVVDAVAGAGVPVGDLVGALPLDAAANDADALVATVQDTLDGLGLPVELPEVALPDVAAGLPAVENVVATVTDLVAGLGLPLGGLLGG